MAYLAISRIYLKKTFLDVDSNVLTQKLQSICDEVVDSHQGKHWLVDYSVENESSFTLEIHSTKEYFWEIEDECDEHNITAEKFPSLISIVSVLGREVDRSNCELLTDEIAKLFDCYIIKAALVS